MREILDIGTLKLPYQQSTFVARQEWIKKNPEAMRRLARSIVEAIHKIKTDKPFAQKILAKYTKIEEPEIGETVALAGHYGLVGLVVDAFDVAPPDNSPTF